MSILTDFEAALQAEGQKLKTEIVAFADEFGPTLLQDAEDFVASLAQIALGAVLTQAPLVIGGTEKFGAAVASVIQQVEAKGKSIALNDAHLAVQSAYTVAASIATN